MRKVALFVSVGSVMAWSGAATAQPYRFVNLADTEGSFGSLASAYPAMNSEGTVAFHATLDDGRTGIFTASPSGGVTTVAASDGPVDSFWILPTINDSGTVVFEGSLAAGGGGGGIFADSGGGMQTVIDTSGEFQSFFSAVLNNAGQVAFLAGLDDGRAGAFVGGLDAAPTLVAESGTPDGPYGLPISFNDLGTVAYHASDGIFTVTEDGTKTQIVGTEDGFSAFDRGWTAINNAGTVAFHAVTDTSEQGVFVSRNGMLSTVVDTSGEFDWFPVAPALNETGTIAFAASLDDGGQGIFTGSDPVADKVVAAGDELFGSAVTSIRFESGLDEKGDIAFSYTLANGISGIAVADLRLPADANDDGIVSLADFLILRANFGSGANVTYDDGDFNEDGSVSLADFLILRANFGSGSGDAPVPALPPIPEPASLSLLTLGGLTLLRRRKPAWPTALEHLGKQPCARSTPS